MPKELLFEFKTINYKGFHVCVQDYVIPILFRMGPAQESLDRSNLVLKRINYSAVWINMERMESPFKRKVES